jgi:glutamine amidotransferase
MMIAVIDYGLGNLFSLTSSLKALGAEAVITADPSEIKNAERLILPGVGAFGDAMNRLQNIGLIALIKEEAGRGKPLLGICLGMQILFDTSFEYGKHPGLGLIPGHVGSLEADLRSMGNLFKVPHMGWNSLHFLRGDCPLLKNSEEGDFVYFVHSYYAKFCNPYIAASADYGVDIPAIVQRDNVYGCQFHPEKSGTAGLNILSAYLTLEVAR